MPPLNIVYLHAHDAGRFIQPYGYPVETPNLMRFAQEGALFRKAFATAPTCAPSRSSLLTGTYPHQHGMFGLPGKQGWLIDDYRKHLVNVLNDWGYETVLAGVQHEANHTDFSSIKYERVLEQEHPIRPQDGEFYQESIYKVERFLAKSDSSRPFFLSVGIDEPHRDNIEREELNLDGSGDRFSKTQYYDPQNLDTRYIAPPAWLPDLPEIRRDMGSFHKGVQIMDTYMGRVLDAIKHNKFEQNTLVIITSDHGIEFPGGKMTLSDQGLQVMLAIRGPEGTPFRGGKVIEPMVSQLDLFPTIVELLGKKSPHPIEGRSLIPISSDSIDTQHHYIFAEQNYHGEMEPLRSVRTERYKYIRRHFKTGPRIRHDGTKTTPIMNQAGWYDRHIGHEELFDLYLDPLEQCNRSEDQAYSSIKSELVAALEAWMESTDDPFPSAKFPDPLNQPVNT